MIAVEFSHKDGSPATDIWCKVKQVCFDNRILTLNCGVHGNGMRFATPLNVNEEELDEGLNIFEKVLQGVE
jgi:4-aminobutyrate aminotransferase and related aminotransferases